VGQYTITNTNFPALHVVRGSAGAVTSWGNTIATLEHDHHGFLSILTPDDRERGILFGEPTSNNFPVPVIWELEPAWLALPLGCML
jgi:hypothetical protein